MLDKRKAKRPIDLAIFVPPRSRQLKPIHQIRSRCDSGPGSSTESSLLVPTLAPPKLLAAPLETNQRKRTRSAPIFSTPIRVETVSSPAPKKCHPSDLTDVVIEVPVTRFEERLQSGGSTPSTATAGSEAKTPTSKDATPLLIPIKAFLRSHVKNPQMDGFDRLRKPLQREHAIALF